MNAMTPHNQLVIAERRGTLYFDYIDDATNRWFCFAEIPASTPPADQERFRLECVATLKQKGIQIE